MKWIKFNPRAVTLPKERRNVLLQLDEVEDEGIAPSVCVGYLRRWSNKNNFFVMPGIVTRGLNGEPITREVTHWCDYLGDDFHAPLWS